MGGASINAQGDVSRIYALLTSLPPELQYFEPELQTIFEKEFGVFDSTHSLVKTKHRADQYDLWTILQESDLAALFWVSHGGIVPQPHFSAGLGFNRVIADFRGADLGSILGAGGISTSAFLGVVSCFSQQILGWEPNAQFKLFSSFVHPENGLKEAIAQGIEYLSSQLQKPHPRVDLASPSELIFKKIQVQRTISEEFGSEYVPSVRISAKGVILGVLPEMNPEKRVQSLQIVLPVKRALDPMPDLVLDSGLPSGFKSLPYHLGQFEIKPCSESSETGGVVPDSERNGWKPLSGPSGVPFGRSRQVFYYTSYP